MSILCWRFPSSSTKFMVDVFVFISAFRFNAAKSFCQRTLHLPRYNKPLVQCSELMGGKHHQQVLPHELSCEFMLYLSELLTMFSIDVFSMHRKVAQDHPCMSFRVSSLNNVRSFDEPATQPTLGKRILA